MSRRQRTFGTGKGTLILKNRSFSMLPSKTSFTFILQVGHACKIALLNIDCNCGCRLIDENNGTSQLKQRVVLTDWSFLKWFPEFLRHPTVQLCPDQLAISALKRHCIEYPRVVPAAQCDLKNKQEAVQRHCGCDVSPWYQSWKNMIPSGEWRTWPLWWE